MPARLFDKFSPLDRFSYSL